MNWCNLPRASALLLALSVVSFPSLARAQAIPVVTGAPAMFIQRGQSVDVTLDGQHLAAVGSLSLEHARGLQVSLVAPDKQAKPAANQLHLHIVADNDAMLGDRELRLISPTGVSAPLRVTVGQYPQVLEKEPNNTAETAQEISFPVTLVGKVDISGDVDYFRFSAAKGQKLVFDVYAARMRSPVDPLLTILDEAGHEHQAKIDEHGGDPTLIFDVPADGRYTLSIRDLQYRGGPDYAYRIDAGAIPYLQSVLPMSVQPGRLTEVKPIGVNLMGADTIPLDLTYAANGEIFVRARASAGMSNAVALDVNELPVFRDTTPADSAASAHSVPTPIDISGLIAKNGGENFYKFHIAQKQAVTLEAITRRMGSSLSALMTLRDAKGNPLQTVDNTAGPDAIISRALDAGDYVVSLRDLFYNGGPTHSYRLQIRSGAAGARTQDFSARFLPDAIRISRGGNAILFVDLQRKADFKGDITVSLDDLPPGITCPPLVVNDKVPGASGMLVLSAAADATNGSFPIKLRASAMVGGSLVVHEGEPMLDGRPVDQAFLTVLDAAPFTLEPVASLTPARLQQLSAEADALAAKLAASNSQVEASQTQWEKKASAALQWTTLKDAKIVSKAGTQFTTLDNGAFLAGNPNPDKDTFTVTANSDQANITAIRIEAIPNETLPSKGPGRALGGNFVLSHFSVTIAPKSDPAKAVGVPLHDPHADFEQAGMPIVDSLNDLKPERGWAIAPKGAMEHSAVFFTKTPIGDAKGAILTFTLDHQFGKQHSLGCFRLSIASDPDAATKATVPANIAKLLEKPAAERSPADKAQIAKFYRTLDPQVAQDIARLAAIRGGTGTFAEIARLEAALAADTPELKTAEAKWEKAVMAGSDWLPLDIATAKSKNGATLTKQPNESILAAGKNSPTDVYTLTSTTVVHDITAIRIEALPDPTLPANGPGRSANGNFVLTKVLAYAAKKDAKELPPPVDFKSAIASFEQAKFPVSAALSGSSPNTGWAVLPNTGKPAFATFYAEKPFGSAEDSVLKIVLEQNADSIPQATLGHFRIWLTSNPQPDAATVLPSPITAILKTAADKRTAPEKTELTAYFRSITPSLEPLRERLAELKAQTEAELIAPRGKKLSIPFLLNRVAFKGEVRVTLEGFIAGRDPLTSAPTPITGAFKIAPASLAPDKTGGSLGLEVERISGTGARYCVLRAEAKVGDDTRVEFSEPFVVTVLEK